MGTYASLSTTPIPATSDWPSRAAPQQFRERWRQTSRRRARLRFAFLTVLACNGCWRGDVRPSTADVLAHPASKFITNGTEVVGLLANNDVDSLLFKYHCQEGNPEEFWSMLDARLKRSRWTEVKPRPGPKERHFARDGRLGEWSLERVHVAYVDKGPTVVVAYVQVDASVQDFEDLPRFEDLPTGRWADHWWKKLRQEVSSLGEKP